MLDDNKILDNSYEKIKEIIANARNKVYKTINKEMLECYFYVGSTIVELLELLGEEKSQNEILKSLSIKLTNDFGKGFDRSNLTRMKQFYTIYKDGATSWHQLSWSHYKLLIKLNDDKKRGFYFDECLRSSWSVTQLERQINSFYYERLLSTQDDYKNDVRNEIQILELNNNKSIIKNPYVLEFVGLKENAKFYEQDLETNLINHIQEFLLELGKGYSFVDRQKRIDVDGENFYIDLVFYNYIMKCFVIIELKTNKLTHQDIGQLDFYVRYYDDKVKGEDDNATIGIILCSDKKDTIVKYSVLNDNNNLFASKYKLYIPTEEELIREIESEKELIESNKD